MPKFTLVIHGGAGTILKKEMLPEMEAAYCKALQEALDAGFLLLENGYTSVESVLAATRSLENNILFNAGKGAVFAKDGTQEMDASIMDGKNLMAGAVSAVKHIKNPIDLAFAVMVNSQHVLLTGKGANDFAESHGIATAADDYFFSQFRYDQWKLLQGSDAAALDHNVKMKDKKFGTVGAVACDKWGNIAAATSTGGMTNKQWGRVGDSSILGAGTYANNKTCAISCTGHGEIFMKAVAAYDVSARMEYGERNLKEAMDEVVNKKLVAMGGEGGMIGVDAQGNFEMAFNSEGMYRGCRSSDGTNEVLIYK